MVWVITARNTFLFFWCTQLFFLIIESSHLFLTLVYSLIGVSKLFLYLVNLLFSLFFATFVWFYALKLIVVVIACVTKPHPLKRTTNRKNIWWSRWWLFIFELDRNDLVYPSCCQVFYKHTYTYIHMCMFQTIVCVSFIYGNHVQVRAWDLLGGCCCFCKSCCCTLCWSPTLITSLIIFVH